MFCTSCGSQNPDGNKFCVNCGAVLQATEPVSDYAPFEPEAKANPVTPPVNPNPVSYTYQPNKSFAGMSEFANGYATKALSFAIAGIVSDEELNPEYILPDAFDARVGKAVAAGVAQAARDTGVARI